MKNLDYKRIKAFTIVELIIIITVIAILAAITMVSYGAIRKYSIQAALSAELDSISNLIMLDHSSAYGYPSGLSALNNGTGINENPDIHYYYYVDNSSENPTYCLSLEKENLSYKITEEDSITTGDCFGLDSSLVLSVDAGVSSSYPGTGAGSTWYDISGNNKNCTLSNGAAYSTEGGGSISFDGIDDYSSCTAITPIDEYSIEAWLKLDTLSSSGNTDQANFGYTIAATSFHYGAWISLKNTEVYSRSFTNNSNSGQLTTGSNINTYDWFYVVITSQMNGDSFIYVNGVLRGTYTAGNTSWSGDFTIGDLRSGRKIGFDGLISRISIYNKIETQSEIMIKFINEKSRYGL